nr:MAG TPA: hypothetical protein [Crassvirales sp.]DAU12252.1 MAG TPA: hypothetical protein [Caudoviricetes sp.]
MYNHRNLLYKPSINCYILSSQSVLDMVDVSNPTHLC